MKFRSVAIVRLRLLRARDEGEVRDGPRLAVIVELEIVFCERADRLPGDYRGQQPAQARGQLWPGKWACSQGLLRPAACSPGLAPAALRVGCRIQNAGRMCDWRRSSL